jgi:hypothetical protein
MTAHGRNATEYDIKPGNPKQQQRKCPALVRECPTRVRECPDKWAVPSGPHKPRHTSGGLLGLVGLARWIPRRGANSRVSVLPHVILAVLMS